MKCFVDTNVLAYAKDSRAPSKQKIAAKWIEALTDAEGLVLSAQSLREYYSVSLRRDRSAKAVNDARVEVARLFAFVPEDLLVDRLDDAWDIQNRHKLGFWDCLLMASALAAECRIFLSEDMNDGQRVGTLTIVNPFNNTPESIIGA